MKLPRRLLALWILAATAVAAQPAVVWQRASGPEYTGDVRWADVKAAGLGPLRVRVYLPPGGAHAPVLYACDGQNCFQPGQYGDWHMDEIADGLIRAGQLSPLIIVAVDAPSGEFRMDYYTARRVWDTRRKAEVGGKAEAYSQFLLALKKIVDRDFSTDPSDSGLIGSSLGGLFSLYGAYAHSQVFGRVAALSPSLWWTGRPGTGDLIGRADLSHGPRRAWLDIGDHEGVESDPCARKVEYQENVDNTRKMSEWLESFPHAPAMHFEVVPGGEHSEKFWSTRLPEVLRWLYPAPIAPGG
jgi:predicted alpha/beta superfamily hydrolase